MFGFASDQGKCGSIIHILAESTLNSFHFSRWKLRSKTPTSNT